VFVVTVGLVLLVFGLFGAGLGIVIVIVALVQTAAFLRRLIRGW